MKCSITNKSLNTIEEEFWARNKKDDTLKILMTNEELEFLERHIAFKMNQYFKDSTETVHLIALLTGAYFFIADLSKYLTFDYSIHFIKVTSYDNQKQHPSEFNKDELTLFKQQKYVVFVDELIDTGGSMKSLKQYIPHAMTCACLSKSQEADFIGCNFVPKLWLIGFGLDDESKRRGWIHLFCKNASEQKIIEFRKSLLQHICQIQQSQEFEVKW